MDSDKLVVESDLKKSSFLEHLFNFDGDSKGEMMNIIQYTILSIIPIILLVKGVGKLIPKVDEDNSSFVIGAEILGQAVLIFLGMLLIHRFVTYFPTYSKKAYAPLHVTNLVVVFLVIAASFQTRIGEKTNILIDRLFDLIEGRSTITKEDEKKNTKSNNNQNVPQHQPSRADIMPGTTHISQLHGNEVSSNSHNQGQSGQNFNAMFAGPNNPMVNAQTPGMTGQEGFIPEPMAANSFGSGSLNAF